MRRLAVKLDDEQTRFFAFCIAAGAVAASILFAFLAYRAHVVSTYPTVSGFVRKCETDSVLNTSHSISVTYQYVVNGKIYNGFKYMSSDDRQRIAELASQYPIGQEIVVSYNPDDPADSYLREGNPNDQQSRGVVGHAIGLLLILSPMLIVGTLFAVAWAWQKLEVRRSAKTPSG